jgi:hypothetical protein
MLTDTLYVAVEASAAVTVYTSGVMKLFGVVPLVCATAPADTPVPVVVKFATRVVTSVPNGRLTAMVLAGSLIVPGNPGSPANEYEVMVLAKLGATVTITVYVPVGWSAADTVYVTGLAKLFGVVPLVCATEPTCTPVELVTNDATNVVTSVPYGMITDIVLAGSFTVPATPASEYAVMTGVLFQLPPPKKPPDPPPHPGSIINTPRININVR